MATELTAERQVQLATRLAARRPAEVDRALASQASLRGCGFRVSLRFPDGGMPVVSSVEASGRRDGLEALASDYRKAMTPATQQMLTEWIAELSVIAPKRADDEFTAALTIRAYASRLADYPADVARAAMLERRWKFFPSWDELGSACDEIVAERKATLVGIEGAIRKSDDGPRRDIGTAESRSAHAARVMAEFFGDRRIGEA